MGFRIWIELLAFDGSAQLLPRARAMLSWGSSSPPVWPLAELEFPPGPELF